MRTLSREPWAMRHEPTRLAANRQFGRYNGIERHEVRQADVAGQSYVEQARRTREMLRSMDPEQVKQVIEFHRDLNFFEALALAKQEGKLIVPNDIHDGILTKTIDQEYLKQNYPVWTGTLLIYEAPDKKFGKKVFYSWEYYKVNYSISFTIPEQFQGKTNCALAIDHPDFKLVDLGKNKYEIRLAKEAEVHLIEQFPKENGRYLTDQGIPIGVAVVSSDHARYLWRFKVANITPLLRFVEEFANGKCIVDAYGRRGHTFNVHLVPLASASNTSDSHD